MGKDILDDFDPANFAPGTFGCHEALDRCALLSQFVQVGLVEHPAIRTNPEWLALAEEVAGILARLYGASGEKLP